MCVNNLSKVALDSAAAGIEPATSSRKSNALTRDCNPGIRIPRSRRFFSIPSPGISGLKKIYFSVENSIYSMIFAIN